MAEFDLFTYGQIQYCIGMIEVEKATLISMQVQDAISVRSMGYGRYSEKDYKVVTDRISAWANDIQNYVRR